MPDVPLRPSSASPSAIHCARRVCSEACRQLWRHSIDTRAGLIVKDTIEEKIVSWQARRMANLSKSAALGLNDFVQLGLAG